MSNHCHHCSGECILGSAPGERHCDNAGAWWDDDCCPACAVAERIALAVYERGRPPDVFDTFEIAEALNRCSAIARGEA